MFVFSFKWAHFNPNKVMMIGKLKDNSNNMTHFGKKIVEFSRSKETQKKDLSRE